MAIAEYEPASIDDLEHIESVGGAQLQAEIDTLLAKSNPETTQDNPFSDESDFSSINGTISEQDEFSSDSLRLYLNEIGRYPLLTPAQEVSLAKRVEQGDERAKEQFIQSNLRLGVSFAKKFRGRGVPFMDLIQEASKGVIIGVEKFDYRKGYKFSTYGGWWIRHSLQRAVADQGRTIRTPTHVVERLLQIHSVVVFFEQVFGREPTDDDLCYFTSLDHSQIKLVRQAMRVQPVSLNAKIGEDKEDELLDIARPMNTNERDAHPDTAEEAEHNITMAAIRGQLNQLKPELQTIIQLRFGLDGSEPLNFNEIGEHLGCSREKVSQLESQALERLSRKLGVEADTEPQTDLKALSYDELMERRGLAQVGSFDAQRSLIAHGLLREKAGHLIAKELGVSYETYKRIKRQMGAELGVEGNLGTKTHRQLIQKLGSLPMQLVKRAA